MSGWRDASRSAAAQWVVARCPSSRPAAPSSSAPVQTEATRRDRVARCCTARIIAGSDAAASVPKPPETMSVSIAVGWKSVSATSTPSVIPEVEVTGWPSIEAISTRYGGVAPRSEASRRTSTGPCDVEHLEVVERDDDDGTFHCRVEMHVSSWVARPVASMTTN